MLTIKKSNNAYLTCSATDNSVKNVSCFDNNIKFIFTLHIRVYRVHILWWIEMLILFRYCLLRVVRGTVLLQVSFRLGSSSNITYILCILQIGRSLVVIIMKIIGLTTWWRDTYFGQIATAQKPAKSYARNICAGKKNCLRSTYSNLYTVM